MKDRLLLEAFLENGEVCVDALISNDFVKDIPVFGTIIKAYKAFDNFKDKLFLAKISRFIEELASVQPEVQEAIVEKMRNHPDEAKKVGEVVLFAIDKASDLEKPEIIAKIFLAYISNQINCSELRRMTEAVNLVFVDDLKTLINERGIASKSQHIYLKCLVSTGLTEVVAGKTVNEGGELYFEITEFGRKFLKAYQYGSTLVSHC
ncbi:hypothetical protein NIES4101_87310 [Calothrix sp. NIES-4101]|nr:hypothetical protein NIES4101_87310 [Calothrix sp. NIES-4101]